MRLSQLFTKTLKDVPKDEVSTNAQLLIRGGFIKKLSAGVYTFLPLGLRVLRKIENIIREEMNNIGGQEILMPVLHPKEIWEEAGRWDSADYLYKLKDRQGAKFALGATHEEVVVDVARKYINSYRDLPLFIYQIQTKFRDELRAKSGLLRGREFSMKDLYSFHEDEEDRKKYYGIVRMSYLEILKRCGFENVLVAEASGGDFSKEYSHEFQILTAAGEDLIIFCENCGFARNKEICSLRRGDDCPVCGKGVEDTRAIEVANTFALGSKYSKPMSLNFLSYDGMATPVTMGCYGMGLSRLMGAVVEAHHDDKGIIWPETIAPFRVVVVQIESEDNVVNRKVKEKSEKIYKKLWQRGIEALYDERKNKSVGEKFADADLLGIPWRVVVSERTTRQGKVELKNRRENDGVLLDEEELLKKI